MENIAEDLNRKQALASYLNIDLSDVENENGNLYYTNGYGEYEVLTDDEATKEALDVFKNVFEDSSPRENLEWAKKWGFDSILSEEWVEDVLTEELSTEEYENYHNDVEALVDMGYFTDGIPEEACDYNKAAKLCLESDGRGILSGYDGEEGYISTDNEDYFIYRIN